MGMIYSLYASCLELYASCLELSTAGLLLWVGTYSLAALCLG